MHLRANETSLHRGKGKIFIQGGGSETHTPPLMQNGQGEYLYKHISLWAKGLQLNKLSPPFNMNRVPQLYMHYDVYDFYIYSILYMLLTRNDVCEIFTGAL